MTDILSLWRSPLDKVAMSEAEALRDRQPHCSIVFNEDFHLMTVYNFGYYYDAASMDPNAALTNMFFDMNPNYLSNNGGLAFIPQETFTVNAAPGGFPVPDQCEIVGSGGGGKATGGSSSDFYHFRIAGMASGLSFLSCTGSNTSGGKYFRSLAFIWTNAMDKGATCISAGTWNCRVINCTFTDCPVAFAATATAESCTLEQSTIQYTQGPDGATAVVLQGLQCGVIGPCELILKSGTLVTCIGVSVQGPAEHTIIAAVDFAHWPYGIDFSQAAGSSHTEILNCEADCLKSALNIQLPSNALGLTTSGIKVTSCTFAKSEGSSDISPVVSIDALVSAGHNMNSQLYDITLVDCTVYSQAPPIVGQYGLQIVSGSNVKVVGGTYSNNGSGGLTSTGAGIAITGPCGDVQIVGANLQPEYPNSPNAHGQQYALVVSDFPAGTVLVSECDMTGYLTPPGPVHVSAVPQQRLFITNCPGYNDQGTTLNGNIAPTGTAVSAATCTTPYFGPSLFTWSNASPVTVTVFGHPYTASFGIIFLPNPYDSVLFGSAPTSFLWTGK